VTRPRIPAGPAVHVRGSIRGGPWSWSSHADSRLRRARQAVIHSSVSVAARAYFDVSYQILTGSFAGRRLLALATVGGGPVHGYFTEQDRSVLLAELDPGPGDSMLDLGSGLGGVAIEMHRRSGAEILGIDISPRAVSSANALADRAGVGGSVRFLDGDLAHPPRIGATRAFAIDSLMFVPDLADALRGIADALGSGGRLFATLLVFGAGGEARLRESLRAAGASVERLDNVTLALDERSRARSRRAVTLRRSSAASLRGRLALRLVGAEERLVRALVANGRVSRWRFVVHFGSMPERDGAHSQQAEDGPRCAQTR
jgi:SAM-dependent methyltransferase